MAQAALKYETEPQETLLIPEGGIATFLTATEGAWADEKDIPQSGIAQVTHIADRLAEYGRHEDEYMVHAAEGETVIPMAVLEANPRLRKNLFAQMEAMGLDPERYVVGSELNSINPVTGQPEFFLKKLFKGVKKLVKKVVKVVKKALPYVLPIALSFTPLGPVFGAALGSGIGTLMQGGDLGDALKAAVISGGIGGLSAGISGMISGQGFGAGVKGAFGNVGERFGQALGGVPEGGKYWGSPFRPVEAPTFTGPVPDTSGLVSGPGGLPAKTAGPGVPGQGIVTVDELGTGPFARPTQAAGPPPAVTPQAVTPATVSGGEFVTPSTPPAGYDAYSDLYSGYASPSAAMAEQRALIQPAYDPYSDLYSGYASPSAAMTEGQALAATVPPSPTVTPDLLSTTTDPSMLDRIKSWGPGGRQTAAGERAYADSIRRATGGIGKATKAQKAAANLAASIAEANIGILSQYGPSLAAAGLVGGAAGMFEPPEPEDDEDEDDPYKDHDPLAYKQYQIAFPTTPTYTMEDIRVPGREVSFAHGGVASLEEFPPRSGGISGPGTGRSDDVPAMLSDGEFVMTAEAVKGAGKGSRNNGMKNMYQLMRTFEASV